MSTFLISRFCEKDLSDNETKVLKDTFGEEIYFDKANLVERKCPEGQIRGKFNDGKTCKHNFELIKDQDGEFVKKQQCKKATRV